ncbi:glutamate--cysteine ligase [Synechococcales cyanobacterium C]|uniref:Glutamate--cysteine ligase n=1 Tax=Petrachloros mirabilis ULC683 TaxID=2781853 RepID=A0A8K1ZX06_9CYAN|nr:glutamate--cysteine ligase [Petrachloros mirabilis]NCJ05652.1 glutamate--cysteine ligase [Petrachloros mirabilis ULC683]
MLSKGFEVELYTGTAQGQIIGFSDKIVATLEGYVREPDSRNVEYTTAPSFAYDPLLCDLLRPRLRLRQYLSQLGDYTLIPGSTLSLGDSTRFDRSDPNNPYHTYIEQTYGSKVVTASIHINIGISDVELLLRACRLIRLEAPLFLALSASSPFLDAEATGYHSTRWAVFPKTPAYVPLFRDHQHFVAWTQEQLVAGTMQNVRHLWSAVRPNGNRRPYSLNRLELRICDLVSSPIHLLAITALLEARITQLLDDPTLDPLVSSIFREDPEQLVAIADANEQAVAHHSLDATLTHWQDGRPLLAKDWVEELFTEVWPTAQQQGYRCFLSPLEQILQDGNEAQQWLQQHQQGRPIPAIIEGAIAAMLAEELELKEKLCNPVAV